MDKRELNMYKLEEAVSALLAGIPIKKIARLQKISKNTVKKYRSILESILDKQAYLHEDISAIMGAFRSIRSQQQYSENHGRLETNTALVEKLTAKCDNYVRLLQVLQEHGFRGSYSSLQRYVSKSELFKEKPVFRIESKPGEIAQVDFGSVGMIYDKDFGVCVKAYVFVMVLGFSRDAYYEIVKHQDIRTWCSCHKKMLEFDFDFNPEINRRKIMDLNTCVFVNANNNMLFVGPTGVGKTFLAKAIDRWRIGLSFLPNRL